IGITIGNVITITVRIKEQVRDLEHKDAAVPEGNARRQVEIFHKISCGRAWTVALGVQEDGDSVCALGPTRRRLRNAVINRARIAIDLYAFEPGRVWILEILNDPEAAAIV